MATVLLSADEADRLGLDLPPLAPPTVETLRARLPSAATVANPLDYTAMIWGEVETLRDLIRTVGEDPAIGHVLVFYDRPPGIAGHSAESWEAVEEGILAGPEAGAAVAALPGLLERGVVARGDRIVLFVTGHGLKYPALGGAA